MTPDRAVNYAIDNVLLEGVDDVFERAPELDFLLEGPFRQAVADAAKRGISGGLEALQIGPIQHANVPKSGMYAFRRCAIVQPMDHIKYLALTLLAAEAIEARRIQSQDRRVFSYRFLPNEGRLFDPAFNFNSFHEAARARASEASIKVVVKCDIAGFYDRLNLHRLESTLSDIGVEKRVVSALNELLIQWARKDSYGLPVGSNASRILAEAALIETDRFLISIGVDFIRFVDDYQFFAPDLARAQFWLYKMMDRLAQEGLGLNAYKTRVFESKSAASAAGARQEAARASVGFRPVRSFLVEPEADERGFYARVPRRFYLPETGESTDPPRPTAAICAALLAKAVIEPPEFRELAISLMTFRQFDALVSLPRILQKHPPYVDYAMGMLRHFKDDIAPELRESLSKELGQFLCSPQIEIPEWHKLQVVRLLGMPEFQNRDAVLSVLRNMPRNSGSVLGRAVFDAIGNFATRGDALEIKEYFERSDPSERRAILRTLNHALPDEEKRAWAKYASHVVRDDLFALHFVKPFRTRLVS